MLDVIEERSDELLEQTGRQAGSSPAGARFVYLTTDIAFSGQRKLSLLVDDSAYTGCIDKMFVQEPNAHYTNTQYRDKKFTYFMR